MKPQAKPDRQSFRFDTASPANRLEVVIEGEEVCVFAEKDNFTPARKVSFVRHLVEEGFIPESFRYFGASEWLGLRWVVQPSRLKKVSGRRRRINRLLRFRREGALSPFAESDTTTHSAVLVYLFALILVLQLCLITVLSG